MVDSHAHNGIDNQQVLFEDLDITAGDALTTANSSALSSGGSNDLKTSDKNIIDNIRTRLNELEARLQEKGLIN